LDFKSGFGDDLDFLIGEGEDEGTRVDVYDSAGFGREERATGSEVDSVIPAVDFLDRDLDTEVPSLSDLRLFEGRLSMTSELVWRR
jgi:hypothetical protein